jgi:hypothetical protein
MTKLFLVTALVLSPGLAHAFCTGENHSQTAMTCSDGKTFDASAQACVPVSG